MSLRSRVALGVGALTARASRFAGFGGQMIGGRVALMLRPSCLSELAGRRRVVLVSGTNGKTTTTAMLAATLATRERVASNSSGANMLDGMTAAMAAYPAPTFVGEVDEIYLPIAVEQTRPAAVVLLNLTRDQLDRAGEIRRTAARMREMARHTPDLLMVANCDDPYVVLSAGGFADVVWVAAGARWEDDGSNCPNCGQRLHFAPAAEPAGTTDSTGLAADPTDSARVLATTPAQGWKAHWECRRCGLSRPRPHWWLAEGQLCTPDGARLPLALRVPGEFNRINAAMAIAAGHALGVAPEHATAAVGRVEGSAGRYQTVQVGSHDVELLLAKNPAGWSVLMDLLCAHTDPVIISVNAREADGHDTSWLYDVGFERLDGRSVVATGERASDLGVRLGYAGVAHTTRPDPLVALEALRPGKVRFVGDYTSFCQVRSLLQARARG